MYNYQINDLFKQAFGVTAGIVHFAKTPEDKFQSREFTGIPSAAITKVTATSFLNTPILMPVKFGKANWKQLQSGALKSYHTPEFIFPAVTLIDFHRIKKIVETEIAGRDGSVTEIIGNGDWIMRIRGLLINEVDFKTKPTDQIRSLSEIAAAPVAIPIYNEMCEWLGIYDVVIKDIDFPAIEGYPSVQPFSMDCKSELPVEFNLLNKL